MASDTLLCYATLRYGVTSADESAPSSSAAGGGDAAAGLKQALAKKEAELEDTNQRMQQALEGIDELQDELEVRATTQAHGKHCTLRTARTKATPLLLPTHR